jgi:L-ascorbate metabolism protein UlaG (beta-lactamase superfamily)
VNVRFKWIGGATWVLDVAGFRMACDPVLCPAGTRHEYRYATTARIEDPVYKPSDFANLDLWLITHAHMDHLDEYGLRVIDCEVPVVAHENARNMLDEHGAKQLTILEWGQRHTSEKNGVIVEVEALPAVPGVKPVSARLAGGVNGYWITVTDSGESLSFYVTGDTVDNPLVLEGLAGRRVDVLIPNMGAACGLPKVSLHVERRNADAMRLYARTGFIVMEDGRISSKDDDRRVRGVSGFIKMGKDMMVSRSSPSASGTTSKY